MRRVRAAGWVVGAVVASAAVAGPAAALAPTKVGWWSEAQQVPGASAPAPPGASGDGITVTAGPNGPASYGAVRYDQVGSGNATLTLKSGSAMSPPPGDGFAVCAVTKPGWAAGANQSWGDRPGYNANLCTPGTLDSAGTSVAFTIGVELQVVPGVIDVAVLPTGSVPFTASFDKPDASSLATSGAPPDSSFAEPAPPPDTAGEPASASVPTGSAPYTSPGAELGPVGPSSLSSPPPVAGAPATAPQVALGASSRPAPALPFRDRSRRERLMAVGALLAMGASVIWAGGRPRRLPRLLGSAGHGNEAPAAGSRPAGIGRFARPRLTPARRLV